MRVPDFVLSFTLIAPMILASTQRTTTGENHVDYRHRELACCTQIEEIHGRVGYLRKHKLNTTNSLLRYTV